VADASQRVPGALKSLAALAAIVVSLLYLANLGLEGLELLPDGAPLFGNLDEAAATLLGVWGTATLFRKRTS
jgi:hypothetical protein